MGPDYKEPKKTIATHWMNNKSPAVKAAPIKEVIWWNVFKDPTLTALVNEGYQSNLSLQSAGVRVLQARAQLAESVGKLYPQQQAMVGDYSYYRLGGSQYSGILPSELQTSSLGFSASWELDFWGKYRRAIRSNDAVFFASLAAYDYAIVTLTADIANAYIAIRTDEEQIAVTNQNIKLQIEGLRIAKARYNNGQTSLLDVEQAQTTLAETQASLPPLISDVQKQKDALGVLLGTIPTDITALMSKAKSRGIPRAPATVEVGIPREAIAKRPDIFQARMEAVSQAEAIGAIKAELYPALSLVGSFDFKASTIGQSSLKDMFNWSNRSITAGPQLGWSILNYGQITNAVRAQDAAFQQSLFSYLESVLKAQQEVQDNITAYIEARNATYLLTKANTAAIMTVKLAMIRYEEGEADFTTVIDAERQQLRVQTSLTNSKGEIAKALVGIYRSLGGGWQIRGCNDIVPEQVKAQMASRTNWGNLLEQKNHQFPLTKGQQTKELYLPNW